MKRITCWIDSAGAPAAITLLVAGVLATPSSSSLPMAPHGDALAGAGGAATRLSSSALLVAADGADGVAGTADDAMLVVTDLGLEDPQVTAVETPYLAPDAGPPERLCATRAAAAGAGPDGDWNTADDVVFDLGQLGSGNSVSAITIGRLMPHEAYTPVRITADSFVVLTTGSDGIPGSSDDALALVTEIESGHPIVRTLPAPDVPDAQRSAPVVLSPAAFVVLSAGPDGTAGSDDDLLYLFTALDDDEPLRTDLDVPYALADASGLPARVSWTRVFVSAAGDDATVGTADDELFVLDELGVPDVDVTTSRITVGPLLGGGAGIVTPLTFDRAVLAGAGPDGVALTADDELLLLSGIALDASVTPLTVGGLGEGPACRPLKLSRRSCAVVAAGADMTFETDDDELVVVTGIGHTEALGRVGVPGLATGVGCRPTRLSAESVLVAHGGDDATLGTDDDLVSLVQGFAGVGVGGFPILESFPSDGAFDGGALLPYKAVSLGGGRAVLVGSGDDDVLGDGGDDVVQVLEGVPEGNGLSLRKLRTRHRARKPEKPTRFRLRGDMPLEDPEDFLEGAVTVSIGNAAQTIPGSAFKVSKKAVYTYTDKKARHGFVQMLRWKSRSGDLLIYGKGVQTGLESTDPDYVPVTIECDCVQVGQTIQGAPARRDDGMKFDHKKQGPGNDAPGPGAKAQTALGDAPELAGPQSAAPGPELSGPESDAACDPERTGPAEDDPGPARNGLEESPPGPSDDAPGPTQEGPAAGDTDPAQEGPAGDGPCTQEGPAAADAEPAQEQEGPAAQNQGAGGPQ